MNSVRLVPGVLVLLALAQVRAQPTPESVSIGLRLDACAQRGLREAALVNALRLELQSDANLRVQLVSQVAQADGMIEISQKCSAGAARVQARLLGLPSALIERALDLSSVTPSLRARTLALGLAELLRAGLAARVAVASAVAVSASQPPAAEAPPTAEAPPQPRVETATSNTAPVEPEPTESSAPSPPTAAGARAPSVAAKASRPATPKREPPRPAAAVRGDPKPAEAAAVAPSSSTPAVVDRGAPPRAAGPSSLGVAPPFELALLGSARWISTDSTGLVGGRIALRLRRVFFGVEGFFGGGRDALGELFYRAGQVLAGYDLMRTGFWGFTFAGTAYGGLGAVWANGDSAQADASSVWSLAWSLGGQLALMRAIDAHWLLALIGEAGYTYGPRFTADSRTVDTLSGPFAGAGLGVVWRPSGER